MACGEPARAAGEPFTSIMARLIEVWGANDVQIYESPRPKVAHSKRGGCIFYNRRLMSALLEDWMKIQNRSDVEPVISAILAHELGHLMHHDFEPERRNVDSVTRELEADRFAGYTLSRLNIRADDIAGYYRLTGDDFAGAAGSHGNSGQRAEAFQQGWRRAELGLVEPSSIGVGGEDHP